MNCWWCANVRCPISTARSPSAMLAVRSSLTGFPLARARESFGAPDGSTPITRTDAFVCFPAAATPAPNPPPPTSTGTRARASTGRARFRIQTLQEVVCAAQLERATALQHLGLQVDAFPEE